MWNSHCIDLLFYVDWYISTADFDDVDLQLMKMWILQKISRKLVFNAEIQNRTADLTAVWWIVSGSFIKEISPLKVIAKQTDSSEFYIKQY